MALVTEALICVEDVAFAYLVVGSRFSNHNSNIISIQIIVP